MVKQYVGARYVPKFASPVEWAADTSYEALTIVTFNNASYTSKVQVPPTVGNPANNPKYWALTGNYNAQVEQYRQETENYNAQVEQYRQETAKASQAAETATQATAKVGTDLATEIQNRTAADNTITENFNDKLQKIQSQISIFKKPIVISIGDSIANGYSDAKGDRPEFSWYNYADGNRYTIYPYQNSGGGFIATGHKNKTYSQLLSDAHNDHPEANIIIVETAMNDLSYISTTLSSSLNAFWKQVNNLYPNARKIFVWTTHSTLVSYADKRIAEGMFTDMLAYGVECYSLTSRIILGCQSDGGYTHLSDTGYNIFSTFMYGALEGSIPDCSYNANLLNIELTAKNDLCSFNFNMQEVTYAVDTNEKGYVLSGNYVVPDFLGRNKDFEPAFNKNTKWSVPTYGVGSWKNSSGQLIGYDGTTNNPQAFHEYFSYGFYAKEPGKLNMVTTIMTLDVDPSLELLANKTIYYRGPLRNFIIPTIYLGEG